MSIFRSLEHNTSLEELDLSGNSQLAEGDSEAVGCAIERMLNVNRTLKVLNLSGCGFDTTVIGASLSEPHTSVTSLRTRVCIYLCLLACLDRPLTGYFK